MHHVTSSLSVDGIFPHKGGADESKQTGLRCSTLCLTINAVAVFLSARTDDVFRSVLLPPSPLSGYTFSNQAPGLSGSSCGKSVPTTASGVYVWWWEIFQLLWNLTGELTPDITGPFFFLTAGARVWSLRPRWLRDEEHVLPFFFLVLIILFHSNHPFTPSPCLGALALYQTTFHSCADFLRVWLWVKSCVGTSWWSFFFNLTYTNSHRETWSVFQIIQGSFGKIISSRGGGNKLKPPEE